MSRRKSGNEFMEHLEAVSELMAVRILGASADDARTLALRIAEEISQSWGGTAPYITSGTYRERRDQLIAECFDGSNFIDLARRFGISERRVRYILAEARKRPDGAAGCAAPPASAHRPAGAGT